MRRLFWLVTGVDILVCVGTNAKVLYWAWYLVPLFLPFPIPATLIIQVGTEAKCPSSTYTMTEKWDFSHYSHYCTATFLGKTRPSFWSQKTPKCHKRGENWEDCVYYTGTLVRNELNPTLHSHGNKSLSHYRPQLDLNYQSTHGRLIGYLFQGKNNNQKDLTR